jgi:hypothetical protein
MSKYQQQNAPFPFSLAKANGLHTHLSNRRTSYRRSAIGTPIAGRTEDENNSSASDGKRFAMLCNSAVQGSRA